MKIKSQKDFFSGLMFTVVGAAFAYGATSYTVGTGARMGPGYFPLLLGVILAQRTANRPHKDHLLAQAEAIENRFGLPAIKWLKAFKPLVT